MQEHCHRFSEYYRIKCSLIDLFKYFSFMNILRKNKKAISNIWLLSILEYAGRI